MHNNLFWRAFLLVILASAFWYTGKASYHYYFYTALSQETAPTAINWSVKELAGDYYIPAAQFTFHVNEKTFQGETDWPAERYLNNWATEQGLVDFSAQRWSVWYDPDNPMHSTLEKRFPLKDILSAAFLWALLCYFLWIGYYASRHPIS